MKKILDDYLTDNGHDNMNYIDNQLITDIFFYFRLFLPCSRYFEDGGEITVGK